jgi:hypothetical protein
MGMKSVRACVCAAGLAPMLGAHAAWPALGPAQPLVLPAPDAYLIRPSALTVADLDRDGADDVVVQARAFIQGSPSQPDLIRVFVLRSRGDGSFDGATIATLPGFSRQWVPQVMDFDHDGALDILFAFHTGSSSWAAPLTVMLARGVGDGSFEPATPLSFIDGVGRFGEFADIDRDGQMDLMFLDFDRVGLQSGSTSGFLPPVLVRLDTPTCEFLSPTADVCSWVGTVPRAARFADPDGDDDLDVMLQTQRAAPRLELASSLWLYRNLGGGQLAAAVEVPLGRAASDWLAVDLDVSGRDDIVGLGRGSLFVLQDPLGPWPRSFETAARGGDVLRAWRGTARWQFVITARGGGYQPHAAQVVVRAPDGTLTAGPARPIGLWANQAGEAAVGDFDRDGRVDLVAESVEPGRIELRRGVDVFENRPPYHPGRGPFEFELTYPSMRTALSFRVVGTDPDGDAVGYELVAPPPKAARFSLDPVTGEFEYEPRSDMRGSDAFEVRMTDGVASSAPFTVTILDRRAPSPPLQPPPLPQGGGGGGTIDPSWLVALLLARWARRLSAHF